MRNAVSPKVWNAAQGGHYETWVGYAERNGRESPGRRSVWRKILDAAEKQAPIRPGERVLDIGGGLDTVLDFLPQVRGFALDPLAARLAKLGLPRSFGNTSGVFERIPFRDDAFDRVFLMNVLDHVRSPREGLAEIARVLRPDGVLVLSVDTFSGWKYRRKRLHKFWARVRGARTKHPWVFSVRDVQQMLRRVGLEPGRPAHVEGTKPRRSFFTARRVGGVEAPRPSR